MKQIKHILRYFRCNIPALRFHLLHYCGTTKHTFSVHIVDLNNSFILLIYCVNIRYISFLIPVFTIICTANVLAHKYCSNWIYKKGFY